MSRSSWVSPHGGHDRIAGPRKPSLATKHKPLQPLGLNPLCSPVGPLRASEDNKEQETKLWNEDKLDLGTRWPQEAKLTAMEEGSRYQQVLITDRDCHTVAGYRMKTCSEITSADLHGSGGGNPCTPYPQPQPMTPSPEQILVQRWTHVRSQGNGSLPGDFCLSLSCWKRYSPFLHHAPTNCGGQ